MLSFPEEIPLRFSLRTIDTGGLYTVVRQRILSSCNSKLTQLTYVQIVYL
jgi:hypothetical protein